MKSEVNVPSESEMETDVRVRADGNARVVLRGRLDAQTAGVCWQRLEAELRTARLNKLEVDASGLRFCDGAGLALLRYLNLGKMTPRADVLVTGLEERLDKIFRGFTAEDYEAFRPLTRIKCHPLPEETGLAVRNAAADLRELVVFLGEIVAKLPLAIWDRKRMRWREVRRVFEQAGANAVPIISLISVLVGSIIAFEAAYHGLGYGTLNATHRAHFRSPFQSQLGGFGRVSPLAV